MVQNATFNPNPSPEQLLSCTLETCPIKSSFYLYRINLAANIVFLALFSVAFFIYLAIYVTNRRGLFSTVAFLLGLASEILGYVGRILSYNNQWNENAFLIQAICLTIGPAFFCAGIYVSLARILTIFGSTNSRIPPNWFVRIFIPCDILALILQGVGGTMAAIALNSGKSLDPGDNVMIAGLSSQVFTLFVFMLIALEFAVKVWRRVRKVGANEALPQTPELVQLRTSWRFKGFLGALTFATLAIFWRCCYRAIELSHGWNGPQMGHQGQFMAFEGAMVLLAVTALGLFHPAVCLNATAGTSIVEFSVKDIALKLRRIASRSFSVNLRGEERGTNSTQETTNPEQLFGTTEAQEERASEQLDGPAGAEVEAEPTQLVETEKTSVEADP